MKRIKSLIAIVLTMAIAISLISCKASNNTAQNTKSAKSANIKIAGSTTVLPLAQIWSEAYMDKNANVNISVSGGGTGTGMSMLIGGSCDIASASRAAKGNEEEKAKTDKKKELKPVVIALDGLALVVNNANKIDKMTKIELSNIYNGNIKNWKQINGDNKDITVIGRDSSSGTYGSFQEMILENENYVKSMLTQPSNQAIADAVSKTPGAIGYVGHAFAIEMAQKGQVKILKIADDAGEYIEPTDANVKSGKYPISRKLYFYTLGDANKDTQAFLDWCTSEGQKYVEKAGYASIK